MKKKTLVLTTLVLSVPIFMMGCSSAKSPTDVVNDYFTELKDEKSDEAKDLVEATIAITEEHSHEENDKTDDTNITKSVETYLSKTNAKVLSEKVKDNKATVKVEVTAPNYSELLEEVIGESITDKFNGETIDQEYLGSNLLKKVKASKTEVRTGEINLVKKDNEWTIKSDDNVLNLMLGQAEYDSEAEKNEIQK